MSIFEILVFDFEEFFPFLLILIIIDVGRSLIQRLDLMSVCDFKDDPFG